MTDAAPIIGQRFRGFLPVVVDVEGEVVHRGDRRLRAVLADIEML